MAGIGAVVRAAARQLADVSTTPQLDAEVLYAAAANQTRSWVVAHALDEAAAQTVFDQLIARRHSGEPVAYITGRQEFYGRDFCVDNRVLVPRPETEGLIDAVLALQPAPKRILELGTGSGCIAITLACELPDVKIIATDIDPAALNVARANTLTHQLSIDFRSGDLYEPIQSNEQFDLIISNPPYVEAGELVNNSLQSRHLQFEPRHALTPIVSGVIQADSSYILRRIVGEAQQYLSPSGTILLEIGATHANQLSAAAAHHFPGANTKIVQEWSGLPRLFQINT